MANIFGLASQRKSNGKRKIEKFDDRELEVIEFGIVNSDLYFPSKTTKVNENDEIIIERNPIHDMVDELSRKNIPHDLFCEVVERTNDEGEPIRILRFGIKAEAFKAIADSEGLEHWANDMANGEIVLEFSETDQEGNPNFIIEEGANTTYLYSRLTEWDKKHADALFAMFGTVGAVKTVAYFTVNEGLNFKTITARKLDAKGNHYSNDKFIKGFNPQV
jgi:hypothetical protein